MGLVFCERKPSSSSALRLLRALSTRHFSSPHPTSIKAANEALPCLNRLLPPKPDIQTTRQSRLGLVFETASNVFEEMLQPKAHTSRSNFSSEPSRRKGKEKVDAVVLSRAVSLCASHRSLRSGVPYHCSALSTGFASNVYVSTSLINLYSKCSQVDNASKVFDEMPLRNIVSWTALITGYAQAWQVNACFDLYQSMRNSSLDPNDLTVVSLLSACAGSGDLRQGRISHCQAFQMGFSSYVHIANALISMYYKCGTVDSALQIFNEMPRRDIVSWNSMITGYSHYGMAFEAIELFKEMEREKVKLDSITYLGILSSCRHAGLLDQGKFYFNSMVKHGIEPEQDHYCCIVDLLGRSGKLQEAREFIEAMPVPANAVIWGTLLSSSRVHKSFWIGIEAAESRLLLEPDCATTHVQLANLYASVGLWDEAARMRKMMKDRGLKTLPGYSWTQIGNEVHKFRAEDGSNTSVGRVVSVLDNLMDHMRNSGYSPEEEDRIFNFHL